MIAVSNKCFYLRPKKLLRTLTLPLIFLIVLLTLDLLWFIFRLPDTTHLIAAVRQYFDRYGLLAIFVSAIIEGALVLGFYYPGGFVIFLGIILAGHNLTKVTTISVLASAGFLLGLSLDYLLGRHGWYHLFLKLGFRGEMTKAERRLREQGALAMALTYWDINLASFTATAAGVLRYPFWRFVFYSLPLLLIWDGAWAAMIYLVGRPALDLISGQGAYAFIVLAVWVIAVVVKHILENRQSAVTA